MDIAKKFRENKKGGGLVSAMLILGVGLVLGFVVGFIVLAVYDGMW